MKTDVHSSENKITIQMGLEIIMCTHTPHDMNVIT